METYCGKQCEECTYKEKLDCQGCNQVPGINGADTCKIAGCCKEKGHKVCITCSYAENCTILRSKGSVPDYRLKDIAEVAGRKERNVERASFLGRWLTILFWLIVPGVVASLLTMDVFQQNVPVVYRVGEILNVLVNISYGMVLLKVSIANEHYRRSGICCLLVAMLNVLVLVLPGTVGNTLALVLVIPLAVVSIYGEYHEYAAHGDGLREIDYELSGKWDALWKWFIGTNGAVIGGIVLTALIPMVGALVVIGATIGVVVVDVLKLVYLYRTAEVFRGYC